MARHVRIECDAAIEFACYGLAIANEEAAMAIVDEGAPITIATLVAACRADARWWIVGSTRVTPSEVPLKAILGAEY